MLPLSRIAVTRKESKRFGKIPGYSQECKNKAVAEYLGIFPIDTLSRHGNMETW